ncbi:MULTISPECIES: AraC family transcriptional regulator [Halomonadaceae]|uniref:AraC family transcriptional regulator n=2 Tax=Vreelandella TaxID=3137766 RepID=A0A7Z0LXG9_9GAMM|nr:MULTISPECIES: AraC family transcriptional regulator [Halomonas]AJY52116.1 transcriptional regulator, AraC family [Halomonas sp. KO116]NYS80230.1 AraC family transcriptional regulator [Halomonas glaciei]|tara:strand:+ start:1016 stop:1783 length:768 start_codon:yes stop_codon:yes gene_type:complete
MALFELHSRNLAQEQVAHTHDFHQLILATCGVTELSMEGRGERVTARRGCLIPSSRHHEYQGDGSNRTLVLDIPVAHLASLEKGSEIERLFDKPRFFSVPPALNQLTHALANQLEQCPGLQNEIAILLLRALTMYLQDASPSEVGQLGQHCISERLDLARLDAWLDQHLADEIRVEQLAALCALSPGHFHSCFRELTGVTPLAYVQRRRLEHARTLVRHSTLSLGHIAMLVGFRDQGSFSRAYRRYFELSPSSDR